MAEISHSEDSQSPQPQRYPKSLFEYLKQNAVYIAGVAVVAVLFAIGLVVLRGCAPNPSAAGGLRGAETEPAYESPYDWSCLDRSNGRYRYIVDGQVRSRLGIDVSENQHEIDWGAVAADDIDFAIVRVGYRGATEGNLYLDEYFWANLDGARAAGIDCGAYFFSQAVTVEEAVEEADFVLEYLNGTPLDYPIAFDSEEVALGLDRARTAGLTRDEMTAIAEAFCDRVEAAGYDSIVYGNAADLARYRYEEIEPRGVWWAEYGTSAPAHDLDIALWQYTNGGAVAGVSTAVDMNIDLSRALD